MFRKKLRASAGRVWHHSRAGLADPKKLMLRTPLIYLSTALQRKNIKLRKIISKLNYISVYQNQNYNRLKSSIVNKDSILNQKSASKIQHNCNFKRKL